MTDAELRARAYVWGSIALMVGYLAVVALTGEWVGLLTGIGLYGTINRITDRLDDARRYRWRVPVPDDVPAGTTITVTVDGIADRRHLAGVDRAFRNQGWERL